MADRYKGDDTVTSPSRQMFLITPHDVNAVSPVPKALRFNAAGSVVLRSIDGTADVTIDVVAGEVLDVRAQYVRATGTTATGIHGLA